MEENVSLCHDGILRLCCRILINKIKGAKDIMKNFIKDLKTFLILWSTQSFSQLGSAMTGFALTLWVYERTGSALQTALLSVCTYAPYVLMSIFAGALSDRWDKKKVMLVCDTFAAFSTLSVLVLLRAGMLKPVHLYLLNLLSGLMNTLQQPASDVAMTLIIPKSYYQKTSGLRSFSNSLITILNPVFATALFAAAGMELVICVDLLTFAVAFFALLFGVKLPSVTQQPEDRNASLLMTVKEGLSYLRDHKLILVLILFLAGVNFVASAFEVALPAFILPRENGGEAVLGIVSSCAGIAALTGSFLVTLLPAPKDRIRVILPDHADLSWHRELSAVFYQDAGVLVSGPADRMASGTGYECKPGCGPADFDSCGNAGQSVFLQKYPAVFYDTHRNAAGRLSDRSCLRTGDGFCRGRQSAGGPFRKRKGIRCGADAVSSGDHRDNDLSGIWTCTEKISIFGRKIRNASDTRGRVVRPRF